MKINWKVRARSTQFWMGLAGVILSPVFAYYGLSYTDITTWESIGKFFANPFLIGTAAMAALSFIGVLTDPTTNGISDSEQAMEYAKPKKS
ncbi:phage holin [Christensenella tenuis]|jgi:phi LC3 family holin|uniref:Phage holin n=1 Tax=Christensenella tenuis TaxID=2763033 RepID=A0ABR7EF17_9FIRM|nr:phage holin [Christensenella tenuis]MBC5648248.1 phage holin [Christensenella tenuis]